MKSIKYIILFIICSNFVLGQDKVLIDTTKKDIFSDKYWSQQSINNLVDKNYDQLRIINEKWNSISNSEPASRLNFLMAIYNNKLNLGDFDNIIENLLIYKALISGYKNEDTIYHIPYRYITGYPDVENSYHEETAKFAGELYNRMDEETESKLITRFYSNDFDSLFVKIQEKNYEESKLNKEYKKYVKQVLKDSFSIKFGLYTGMWIPTNKLNLLGNHLNTGFQMGLRGLRGWGLNLNMCQRFQDLPDSIQLNFNDTIRNTIRFIGGFYGIDISRNLFTSVRSELDVMAGVAVDGFNSTRDIPNEKRYVESTINSMNFNFGIAYRFIIKQQYFTEIQCRYHIINYDSKIDVTDLTGNALTINISIGILTGGRTRLDILRSLDYKF